MAANATGLLDEDGEFSDWIEIYNPGREPVSLQGWKLTDDEGQLKWSFPNVVLPRQTQLLVFASGKDRTNAAAELHTNFSLDRDGEYLALVRPDGTVASSFAPEYPAQITDVSYGVTMHIDERAFVPAGSTADFLAPADQSLSETWMLPETDSSSWAKLANGVGYDRIPPGERDPSEPVSALGDVTVPGDFAVATSANSPGNETVINAIDDSAATKYLNFDKLNAGFTVRPSRGASVVTGLRLTSANDAPERDPASFLLSGSNDGHSFTEIARGSIPSFSGRFVPVSVAFFNSVAYQQYRLLFPSVRNADAANSVQIAEVEFLGFIGATVQSLAELIEANIEAEIFGRRSSAYLRFPFEITTPGSIENLRLRMHYDDGFAAWLNGVLVATANAPDGFAFNGVAVTNRYRRDAAQELSFDLNSRTNLLRPGRNILAVQAFNDRADSADFLVRARLDDTKLVLGETGYFAAPTPGAENSEPSPGVVAEPMFSQPRGLYEAGFALEIFCPTEGAQLRYTTDGSAPTPTNGLAYTGPLYIERTLVVRAAAFRTNWLASPVATFTYIFPRDVISQTRANAVAAGFPSSWNGQPADYGLDPRVVGGSTPDLFGGKYARTFAQDLRSLPSVSLVMNRADMFGPRGIYANPEARGAAWERPVSIELLNPNGTAGFQEDAGIRIQGGAFRRFDLTLKKSFRVIFRERYGSSELDFPFFGENAADQFQNFVLRANSNDAWPYGGGNAVYVRDVFAMESMREMGRVVSHSRFVHLYINGQYWGLYNPTERPDAAFSATYHGGDRDTWDAINQDSAPDGNYEAWNRLLTMVSQNVSNNAVYQRLQGNNPDGTRNPAYEDLIDIENMIDYMIMNFYVGNADWPHRNWWSGRDRNNGDGFQFYPWDTETALGLTSVTHDSTGVSDAVARPYAALRANADFRLHFADRVYKHFYNGGAFYVNPAAPSWNPAAPENNRPAARFAALADGIRGAIVGETARWGDQLRDSPFTRDEHWQRSVNSLLANYFPRRSFNVLEQLRDAGLFPRTEPPVMNTRGGVVDPGFQLTLSAPAGRIYYTTNGIDPRVTNNASLYTGPVSLHDLTRLKARVLNGTEWSALNEATFLMGTASLGLSELHYHPADPTAEERAAGFLDANDFEFIELFNNGTAAFDLTGLAFTTGIQFNFADAPRTLLRPGEYFLLVKNRAAFEKRYGAGLPVAGEYSGRLDNSGEQVVLENRDQPLFDFTYGTRDPWPRAADGSGVSLELIDPAGNLNDAANWRPSVKKGGSPGRANPAGPVNVEVSLTPASGIAISFAGIAGLGYTVYAAETLVDSPWQVIARADALTVNRRVEISVPMESNRSVRFFRISIP